MDMRYLAYCQPGNPYYDVAPVDLDRFEHSRRALPDDWARTENDDWVYQQPTASTLRGQGWKIHISAQGDNAEKLLSTVYDYCIENEVAFKFLRSRAVLDRRSSKYGDRTASGKFVTIYPSDDDQMLLRVLEDLDAVLSGQPGPSILTDLRYRSGPLYVRYGGFVARMMATPDGREVHAIEDPDGLLVADVRKPGFKPPPWVTIPPFLEESVKARSAGTLGDFPFRATEALHFSNGGGVYRATDTRSGTEVLLKEGRPMAGLDEDGQDAVDRLECERWALDRLAGLRHIPALIDYRRGHEHYFLAREFIDGMSLMTAILEDNPLMTGDLALTNRGRYTRWALEILASIEEGVRLMHQAGVVFGDVHPNNVLIDNEGAVRFIDFESSTDVAADLPQRMGAPGFRAPAAYRGRALDNYGVGCLYLAIFLPMTITVAWGPEKVHQLLDEIRSFFPIPEDFADRVWTLLGDDPFPGTRDARALPRRSVWPHPPAQEGDPQARDVDGWDVDGWDAQRATWVERILQSATPERADRLYPGDPQQFLTPGGGVNLATGAAGVLLALTEIGAHVPVDHVDWLVRRVSEAPPTGPGLYDGAAGIAYALHRVGRESESEHVLRSVIDGRAGLSTDTLSLHGGAAGVGLVLLHLAGVQGSDELLARAAALGQTVPRTPPPPALGRPGLVHGPSGVALFLLRLSEVLQDEAYLDLAVDWVHADLKAMGWGQDGPAHTLPWRMPSLAGGGVGVALVADLICRRRRDPILEDVRTRIRHCLEGPFVADAGLFRGRAGVLAALGQLDGPGAGNITVARHLHYLGWHVVPTGASQAGFLGDNSLRLSTDLATGSAGVLLGVQAAMDGSAAWLPMMGPVPVPDQQVVEPARPAAAGR